MAISESHVHGDSVVHLEARGVRAPHVQHQIVVRIRSTSLYCWADTLAIVPTTIHRFHLGQIPLLRALPATVSIVAGRSHGVPPWDVLLRRFSSRVAVEMTAVSALEMLVLLLRASESNEDVEMAEAVHDYVISEGVPATGSGFECFTYGRGDGVREEECVICLMEFDAGAEVSRMPYSHTFHSRCIIQWLEMSNVCPICRSQVPTASSN